MPICFIMRVRHMWIQIGGKGVNAGETIIGIYYMRKMTIFNKRDTKAKQVVP